MPQTRAGDRDKPGREAKRQRQILNGILKALQHASSEKDCTFTCGGTLERQQPVRIFYKNPEQASWPGNCLTLPGCQDISGLVEVCKAATFGQGKEEVLDQSYRKALALDPANFMVDLELGEHNILCAISKIAHTAASLTASLYKLNIYRSGDFFKSHLDTPRATNMIGSLVICLPSAHTGGQLVVQHSNTRIKYEWGRESDQNDQDSIHWAFFYSDVQHEILKVKTGSRITLTYNVFALPSTLPPSSSLQAVSLMTTSIGKALSDALNSTHFLPNGGQLGFSCAFLYPHTGKGFGPVMLKGVDALIMGLAQELQLQSDIAPIWKPTFDDCLKDQMYMEDDYGCECSKCAKAGGNVPNTYAVGGKLAAQIDSGEFGDESGFEACEGLPKSYNARPADSVLWVQKDFKFQLGLISMGWGNEPCLHTMYSAAAIIIKIPAVEERYQQKPSEDKS